eukprot:TRINITY_DN9997_c0_g2_i1.p1 TRINITY_DN9997_c0_g2~~TRINITY_DN9997_c0_g2_i1.p1  ORF type:complete len:293 (-),score=31.65 TRINITY_DN9997_c0_g2_i1:91-969(-)
MQDASHQLQHGILGAVFLLTSLLNLAQLLSHPLKKRSLGAIPLLAQQIAVTVCALYGIYLWLIAFGPHHRATFSIAVICFDFALVFKACACAFAAFETTRNAYIAMYIHAKTPSPLPFQLASLLTCLCILLSLFFQLITNQLIYSSLAYFSFGVSILSNMVITIYSLQQLRAACSESAAEALKPFFRTNYTSAPLVFLLASLSFWFGISAIQTPELLFEEERVRVVEFDYLGLAIWVGQVIVTVWAWRPLWSSEAGKTEPTSPPRDQSTSNSNSAAMTGSSSFKPAVLVEAE